MSRSQPKFLHIWSTPTIKNLFVAFVILCATHGPSSAIFTHALHHTSIHFKDTVVKHSRSSGFGRLYHQSRIFSLPYGGAKSSNVGDIRKKKRRKQSKHTTNDEVSTLKQPERQNRTVKKDDQPIQTTRVNNLSKRKRRKQKGSSVDHAKTIIGTHRISHPPHIGRKKRRKGLVDPTRKAKAPIKSDKLLETSTEIRKKKMKRRNNTVDADNLVQKNIDHSSTNVATFIRTSKDTNTKSQSSSATKRRKKRKVSSQSVDTLEYKGIVVESSSNETLTMMNRSNTLLSSSHKVHKKKRKTKKSREENVLESSCQSSLPDFDPSLNEPKNATNVTNNITSTEMKTDVNLMLDTTDESTTIPMTIDYLAGNTSIFSQGLIASNNVSLVSSEVVEKKEIHQTCPMNDNQLSNTAKPQTLNDYDDDIEKDPTAENGNTTISTPMNDVPSVTNLETPSDVLEPNESSADDSDESLDSIKDAEVRGGNALPAKQNAQDSAYRLANAISPTSIIGPPEQALDPDPHDITVSIVTWNLGEESPTEDDSLFLKRFRKTGYLESKLGSDLVLIGCQETENTKPRRTEGHRSRELRRIQIKMMGKKYVPLALHSLGGVQLALFCRRKILSEVELVRISDVACGVGNVFHNKGAIGAFVQLKARNGKDTSRSKSIKILFVVSHLAAHVSHVAARNADYWRIVSELGAAAPKRFLEKKITTLSDEMATEISGPDLIKSMDHIFWAGDLNYRLDLPRELVEHTIFKIQELRQKSCDIHEREASQLLKGLLKHDQLLKSICEGSAFTDLYEGPITFLPTFKFDKGTNSYDSSKKQRIPAWTDRILFKPERARLVEYTSVFNSMHSDHRPVYASFLTNLKGRAR